MERLKRMSVFAKVVECGSFTAAARQLDMSVSSISQTVSKLENELQVKLLNRSTRRIGLTEAGMLKEYPGLTVNLVTGIPAPDLIADGLDVVIRTGALQDSSLFSKRLGSMPMVICAAKSYLSQHGTPQKPSDMVNFTWLEYSVRPDSEFELIAPEGITTRISPQGRFVTNDSQTMIRWLKAGAGIAYAPLMWVIEEIKRGEIEILFKSYHSDPRPVYALYTEKDKLPLKVQVCIDYLTEYFKRVAEVYQGYR
jgi:DNA-binding transcriptional LysR family regulator